MMRLILTASFVLTILRSVAAQDPGSPDSMIVEDGIFGNAAESVFARVYAVTDDPVAFFNTPLHFTSTGQGITFSHVTRHNTVSGWDENYDYFLTADDYLRLFGIYDTGGGDNIPLDTGYQREQILNIVFDVAPDATDQIIHINPAFDGINGPPLFGLADGTSEFAPNLRPGQITFGNPVEVPTLSQWGYLIMALTLLAVGSAFAVRRDELSDLSSSAD